MLLLSWGTRYMNKHKNTKNTPDCTSTRSRAHCSEAILRLNWPSLCPALQTLFVFNYNNIHLVCLAHIVLTDNRDWQEKGSLIERRSLHIIHERVEAEMSLPEQGRNEAWLFVCKPVKSHEKTVIGFIPSVQLLVYLPSARGFHTHYQFQKQDCFQFFRLNNFSFLILKLH